MDLASFVGYAHRGSDLAKRMLHEQTLPTFERSEQLSTIPNELPIEATDSEWIEMQGYLLRTFRFNNHELQIMFAVAVLELLEHQLDLHRIVISGFEVSIEINVEHLAYEVSSAIASIDCLADETSS